MEIIFKDVMTEEVIFTKDSKDLLGSMNKGDIITFEGKGAYFVTRKDFYFEKNSLYHTYIPKCTVLLMPNEGYYEDKDEANN